jgi:hypothetical protein
MIKPTVEDINRYCLERGNRISADAFIDYYESVGWLIGKKPMKDWKASVRTWERKNNQSKPALGLIHRLTDRSWAE